MMNPLRIAIVILAVAAAGSRAETITIDASHSMGASNQKLNGVGWNTGVLDGVAALVPHGVRIDASLENASTAEGVLNLEPLLAKVANVRTIGAEPLVILSYMPSWLAQKNPSDPRDATKIRPSNLEKWRALIGNVVTELAAAAAPACRFEVWNEPNIPIFWQDSPTAFLDLARATHEAVAGAAKGNCDELEIGGPAAAFPDPAFLIAYVEAIRAADLPLDFVSWHYYGNYPFLGPDGAENTIPRELLPAYPLIGRKNPVASPSSYGLQIEMVRAWIGAALAGSRYEPDLYIDEWNLSAGGYDLRNDTNEGAAFAAGVLIEMEQAGLHQADFYRAADGPCPEEPCGRVGDWGLVDHLNQQKPVWWVFHAWTETAGDRLAVSGVTPLSGLWARATTAGDHIDLLLASFSADGGTDREITVRLDGACAAQIRTLATADGDLDLASATSLPVTGGVVALAVPKQSVVWARFTTEGCNP
jgi:hypothetical protein